MLASVKKKLEAKMMENASPHDLRAGNLLDELYFAIDSGKVSPKARVIFGTFMTSMFKCDKCWHLNEKACIENVVRSKIDWEFTEFGQLTFFAWSLWGAKHHGKHLQEILWGKRCQECGELLPEERWQKIIREPVINDLQKCDKCMKE